MMLRVLVSRQLKKIFRVEVDTNLAANIYNPSKTVFRAFSSNSVTHEQAKGIVLILPWLKAPKTAIKKYEELYARQGFEPLTYQANLKDFIFPKSGLESSLITLNYILEILAKSDEKQTKIVVHSSSVGCYFYALLLWQMKRNPDTYAVVKNAIVAQVCDSPVIGTLNEMAYGVGKMLSPKSDLVSRFYHSICMLYFGWAKDTVSLYDELILTFKHDAPAVPSLICSAENDPMRIPVAYEDLCNVWKGRSLVLEKVWAKSQHAQNLRYYPEEYESLITELLTAAGVS